MRKRNLMAALMLGGAISVTMITSAEVSAEENVSGRTVVTVDTQSSDSQSAKIQVHAKVEGNKISSGDMELTLPEHFRAASTQKRIDDNGEMVFDVLVSKDIQKTAPVTGDGGYGMIGLLAAVLVLSGGTALVAKGRWKKGATILSLTLAGGILTLSCVGTGAVQAAGTWNHSTEFTHSVQIGSENVKIDGTVYYNLETDGVSDSEPAVTTEKPDQGTGNDNGENKKPDQGTGNDNGESKKPDQDAANDNEEAENPDKTDETDEKMERAKVSLAALNENMMNRMQFAYSIEKEDPEEEITPEDIQDVLRLDLSGMSLDNYDFLYLMPKLEELSLGNNDGLTDDALYVVGELGGLKKLVLAGTEISDLTPVSGLTALEVLNISDTGVTSLQPLEKMTNLKELDAYDLAEDEEDVTYDFAALSKFVNMEKLDVTRVPLKTLDFASNMPHLTKIVIEETGVSDLSPLSDKAELTELHANGNEIEDISPIAGLTGLHVLEMKNNRIADVSALSEMTGLESLALENNSISEVAPLSALSELRELALDGNQIEDVSSLSGLTKLEHLRLNNNRVGDASALSGLTALKALELRDNEIENPSPFADMTTLEVLNLNHNRISDVTPLRPLWNDTDSDRTVLVEDQQISMELDRAGLDNPVNLLGAEYEYNVDKEGFSVNEEGKLVAAGQADTNEPLVITFALKKGGEDSGSAMTASYNRKHGGTITVTFTGERAVAEVNITGHADIADASVTKGRPKTEWESQLPTEVEVTLSDGRRVNAHINQWKGNDVNVWRAGRYKTKAEFTLPDGVTAANKDTYELAAYVNVTERTAEPEVYVDASRTYYYHSNPVLELRNFGEVESVKIVQPGDYFDKTFREGNEYTYDSVNKVITLNTHRIFQRTSKKFGNDERLDLDLTINGKVYNKSIEYHRYRSLYFTKTDMNDVNPNSEVEIEFISDQIDQSQITLKAIRDSFMGEEELGDVTGFRMKEEGEKTYIVVPYASIRNYVEDRELTLQIGSREEAYSGVTSNVTLHFSDAEPEDAAETEAALKPWTAAVEERESDGSYEGDPIYPYDGGTTVKIEVSGEGITKALLDQKEKVTIHVDSDGRDGKIEFDTTQWYAQESGGKLYIRIKTGSLEQEPAYAGRSPYPRTGFTIAIDGYESRTVYVRYAA